MRAAVAVAPVRDFYHTPHRFSALGARTAASVLARAGWDTKVFNFPLERTRGSGEPLPGELSHLAPFIVHGESGPVSWFEGFRRFGPSFEECALRIKDFSPDAVFISCFAYCYAEETVRLAEAVKAALPGVPVAVGGPGATVSPGFFSGCSSIDHVLPGEAEIVLPEFLNGRHSLDAAPRNTEACEIEPAIGITKETETAVSLSLSVSRGCPGRCRFCSNHLTHGRNFRTAPLEKVRDTVRLLPSSKRTVVNFEDDNLLASKEYFFNLIRAFRDHIPGDVRFLAENGIDYTLLDDYSVDALIGSGMLQFNLSLGTSNGSIRAFENRNGDPDRLSELLRRIHDRGIPSVTYFICGLERDTRESVVEDLLFLTRLPTRTGISLFYPVPGLPGFPPSHPVLTRAPRLAAGSSAWPWTGSLDTSELITAFRLARFSNLLRSVVHVSGSVDPRGESLIAKVLATGRLHTYIKDGTGYVCREVPSMKNSMVAEYLSGI